MVMPKVVFIEHGGARREVEVPVGHSIMEGAVRHGIDGIVAECGGSCTCATCHVFIEPSWREIVGPPNDLEQAMLEALSTARENSRLSCQIKVTSELDGVEIQLPEDQIL
jgi:2Fe-2S ferredoxin